MNAYALQQIMGQSDLEVLRRYLAPVEEDLEDGRRRYGAGSRFLVQATSGRVKEALPLFDLNSVCYWPCRGRR